MDHTAALHLESAQTWGHREQPPQAATAHKHKHSEGISNKYNQHNLLQQPLHAGEDKHLLGHGGSLQTLTVSGLFSLHRPMALSLVRHRTGRSCVPLPQLTEHWKEMHQLDPWHPLETLG